MQPNVEQMSEFASLLVSRALTAVAIVDDAYDDWWTQVIRPDEADEIWSLIENSPEATDVLSEQGPEVKSASDITATFLKDASLAEGSDGAFAQIVENSEFRKRVGTKTSTVTAIQDQMKDRLGLRVLTQGSQVSPEKIQGVQIVFLDWMLGPDHDQESKKKARKGCPGHL